MGRPMTDDRFARSTACPGGEGLEDEYVASVAAVELVRAIAQVLSTPVDALVRNLDDARAHRERREAVGSARPRGRTPIHCAPRAGRSTGSTA